MQKASCGLDFGLYPHALFHSHKNRYLSSKDGVGEAQWIKEVFSEQVAELFKIRFYFPLQGYNQGKDSDVKS